MILAYIALGMLLGGNIYGYFAAKREGYRGVAAAFAVCGLAAAVTTLWVVGKAAQ